MKGTQRRPMLPIQFVIFQAATPEMAEHYAQEHGLVINTSEEPFRASGFLSNLEGNEWAAREWSLVRNEPTYYLANRLEPFNTSQGDKL